MIKKLINELCGEENPYKNDMAGKLGLAPPPDPRLRTKATIRTMGYHGERISLGERVSAASVPIVDRSDW